MTSLNSILAPTAQEWGDCAVSTVEERLSHQHWLEVKGCQTESIKPLPTLPPQELFWHMSVLFLEGAKRKTYFFFHCGFYFISVLVRFYCQVDNYLESSGQGKTSIEELSIRLACGQVSEKLSWLVIDVRGRGPLRAVLSPGKRTSWAHAKTEPVRVSSLGHSKVLMTGPPRSGWLALLSLGSLNRWPTWWMRDGWRGISK